MALPAPEANPEATPEAEADPNVVLYSYSGTGKNLTLRYPYSNPYYYEGYYHLLGKRSAEPQPEKLAPKPFAYQYGVKDDHSGASFDSSESQNAEGVVTGKKTHYYLIFIKFCFEYQSTNRITFKAEPTIFKS